jgi:hypothetical protein
MPDLTQHNPTGLSKVLLVGDSGAGKTGALACLANAGYNLYIFDYDNGLDVLHSFVEPEARSRVHFITLTDRLTTSPTGPIPLGVPSAITRAMRMLDHWCIKKEGEVIEDCGRAKDWGERDVLVKDSLTLMGIAALRRVIVAGADRNLADRIAHPWPADYGEAMNMLEGTLQLLFSDLIQCNVVVTAHIVKPFAKKKVEVVRADGSTAIQEIENDDAKGFPSALGRQLPPKVGRYFNSVLRVKTEGVGPTSSRLIHTVSDGEIELKTPAPHIVPPTLPIKDGLVQYFDLIRKAASGEVAATKQ